MFTLDRVRANILRCAIVGAVVCGLTAPVSAQAKCIPDPGRFLAEPNIARTIAVLALTPKDLTVQGCPVKTFTTAMGKRGIFITYPIDLKVSNNATAALLHELGHVFQLRSAGSEGKLMASLQDSMMRRELGADFIAGWLAARYKLLISPADFASSPAIIGEYAQDASQSYGTPAERIAAFRTGYFRPPGADPDLASANRFFQRELFGGIVAQEATSE